MTDVPVPGGPGEPAGRRVPAWFRRRTWDGSRWSAADLVAAKAGRTVSVVIPALDEDATVADVVRAVAAHGPGRRHPLVDEIVVMDGGSRDRTAERAAAAGAEVVPLDAVLPGLAVRPGKGEVLWRSLVATGGDLVVFVDADLVGVQEQLVVALLGPLLTVDGVELVKGFYHRPLGDVADDEGGGGRVTELMARPLLARFAPELAGVLQPLGGEYAATRSLLRSLPFAPAYGVEVGLLLDTLAARGLDAIGQVDLGVRRHRNRDLLELGVMAQQVLATVLHRAGVDPVPRPVDLVQYRCDNRYDGEVRDTREPTWRPVVHAVDPLARPPMGEFLSSRRTSRALPGT